MSNPMATRHLRGALVELGWSGRDLSADLRAFQYGYALGRHRLVVDGVNGPLTREAVRESLRRRRAGRPDASVFFRFAEFACSCGGALPGCRRQLVDQQLLLGLDAYRRAVGGPVDPLSGYRCPERNRRVGGASASQHLHGRAADLAPVLTVARVRGLGVFTGIGRTAWGRVRHVDVRPGSAARPATWRY